MDTFIEYRDGTMLSLVDKGFITKDIIISPIEIIDDSENIDYRPGKTRSYIEYGSRKIVVKLLFLCSNEIEFSLKRDILFSLFSDKEPFYLYEGRPTDRTATYDFELPGQSYGENNQLPSNIERLKGKRYKVIRTSMSDIEQKGLMGNVDIEFETYSLPFAESSAITTDEHIFSNELWQTGQGILSDNPSERTYTFVNRTSFSIINAGNIDVRSDLRDMYLEIEFKGSSTALAITNTTTNTRFKNFANTTNNDTIKISTPYIFTKNGVNIFDDVEKRHFLIKPGVNNITITGSTNFTVSFKFRFYYK